MQRFSRSAAVLLAIGVSAFCPLLETQSKAAEASTENFDAQSLQSVADAVAKDLMRGIKAVAGGGPLKLAVQPFRSDVIVDKDAVARLNDAVERSLKEAGGATITLIDRSSLAEVWREAEQFQVNATLEAHLKDAGADILVLGTVWPAQPDGYQLSYKADDLRPGHTGEVVGVMSAPHVLPGSFAAASGRPLGEAIRTAANRMAEAIAAGLPDGRKVQMQPGGDATPFADYAVHVFIDEVQQQLPEAIRQHAGQQAVSGAAPVAAPPVRLTVRPTVFDLGKSVVVEFAAESPDGSTNASVMTPGIGAASISANLLPLKPQCGKGVQTASGEAVVSKQLDRDAAKLAARSLARARAIAEETCVVFAGPAEVRDPADVQWALKAIAGGLTTKEQWSETDLDGGARVRAVLTASVLKLGGGGVPTVRATLSTPTVQTDVPFSLTLHADAPAHIGVFDWQSDDHVLLLYPYGADRSLHIAAGKDLKLPRPGDYDITTAPRPHLNTDYEALIVVASAKPLDYARLAPEPGVKVDDSLKRAVPVAELFEALASLQTPLTLTVVPYQIVPKP